MRSNTLASIAVPIFGLAVLAGIVALQADRYIPSGPPDREVDPHRSNTAALGPTIDEMRWESVTGLPKQLAIWETVFWEPQDTTSLRQLILGTSLVKDKSVLEIGTGSGLLSLCCLQAGAKRVLATDVNQFAIANAAFNADRFGWADALELRQVPLDDAEAFSVIAETERFDLIISNPPWEDDQPTTIDSYALYDKDFRLLKSLLAELREHLKPGGRALLAYGCGSAIRAAKRLAEEQRLELRILDDRDLETLPEVFLPGMLMEVRPRELNRDRF